MNINLLKLGLLPIAALLSNAAVASGYIFEAGDSSKETKLCVAAAQGDLEETKRLLKFFREYSSPSYSTSTKLNTQLKVVTSRVYCNDMNLIEFSAQFAPTSEVFNYYNENGYSKYRMDVEIVDEKIALHHQRVEQMSEPTLVVVSSR